MTVLRNAREHISAEDIYLAVHKKYPHVGLATVYRTLDLFERMGMVSKLQFGDGRNHYELAEEIAHQGHHHHLVCTNCKRVIDYDDFVVEEKKFLQKVEKTLSRKHRFHIAGHAIQFHGTCSRCAEQR